VILSGTGTIYHFLAFFITSVLLLLSGSGIIYCIYSHFDNDGVGIATDYGLDDRGSRSSSPCRLKNFPFTSSRPVLGPSQPPVQLVPGTVSSGVKLVPMSRKCGSVHPLPHTPSWRCV
jgi:hypothetical protein